LLFIFPGMGDDAPTPFTLALIAGGIAGITVDISLHPIDTIKTRLMAQEGFWKSGGMKGTWKGVVPVALGAAPSAAVFFSTYESFKGALKKANNGEAQWWHHSVASSLGEICACSVRVPTMLIANNMQVGKFASVIEAVTAIHAAGGIGAFWTGFGTMVARDIPFACLQFPIYEKTKAVWAGYQGAPTSPLQGACCGSFAGSISGAMTTPLEVVKTRIMLDGSIGSQSKKYTGTLSTLSTIAREEGVLALYSGIAPRVFWITLGGFVFFGAYENASKQLWKTGLW
jgi:solute carrier family 25 S-adenosylmethionine transporter 26